MVRQSLLLSQVSTALFVLYSLLLLFSLTKSIEIQSHKISTKIRTVHPFNDGAPFLWTLYIVYSQCHRHRHQIKRNEPFSAKHARIH